MKTDVKLKSAILKGVRGTTGDVVLLEHDNLSRFKGSSGETEELVALSCKSPWVQLSALDSPGSRLLPKWRPWSEHLDPHQQ